MQPILETLTWLVASYVRVTIQRQADHCAVPAKPHPTIMIISQTYIDSRSHNDSYYITKNPLSIKYTIKFQLP